MSKGDSIEILVRRGMTNRQIAANLGVRPKEVGRVRRSIGPIRQPIEQEVGGARRYFIKGGVAALVLAGAGTIPYFLKGVPSSDPLWTFERGYTLNLSSANKVYVGSPGDYYINSGENVKLMQGVSQKGKLSEELTKSVTLQSSTEEKWVKFETDPRFVKKIILGARDSIDHLVEFLGSPNHVTNMPVYFEVPQKAEDIKMEEKKYILFYVVSELGRTVRINYKIPVKEGINYSLAEFDQPLLGLNHLPFPDKDGNFNARKNNFYPTFYATNNSRIYLIETPAIEFLHNSLRKYTLAHVEKEVGGKNMPLRQIRLAVGENSVEEEKFVHALSILWLRKYNSDRKLGLTEQELSGRFSQYEQGTQGSVNQFQGVNDLSQFVNKIGVANAINMYVNNPRSLFKMVHS